MSVKGQGQMQKNAKFHFMPIFCGLEKSICYPFDSHKILQTCSKIYRAGSGISERGGISEHC